MKTSPVVAVFECWALVVVMDGSAAVGDEADGWGI